jgi:hypothetical protein
MAVVRSGNRVTLSRLLLGIGIVLLIAATAVSAGATLFGISGDTFGWSGLVFVAASTF